MQFFKLCFLHITSLIKNIQVKLEHSGNTNKIITKKKKKNSYGLWLTTASYDAVEVMKRDHLNIIIVWIELLAMRELMSGNSGKKKIF